MILQSLSIIPTPLHMTHKYLFEQYHLPLSIRKNINVIKSNNDICSCNDDYLVKILTYKHVNTCTYMHVRI